jgi:Na+-driven multidrug efflux pump
LLRKAVIVFPLTVLLPRLGFGVLGVFMAEPVSNVVGGLACYITMRKTVYKKIEESITLQATGGSCGV